MKTYDFATGAIFVGLLALVAQGAHTEATAITECERIDNGGYFTFADPTCAAAFWDAGSEEPALEEEEAE
jgi:hypothetical protein